MRDLDALLDGPAWALREAVLSGTATVTEVTASALARIAQQDPQIHSFLTVDANGAMATARRIEAELAAGEPAGPLCGVPVSVKDLFETNGLRTTSGSRALADHVPTVDSVHAERLRAAGAVLIGKTNTPEFGIFPRTTNDLMAESRNPWDHSRSCGGSSGGAAASVAAGLTPLAVGSDGGGSTRIPAALCGVVGFQPSFGVVPHVGGIVGTVLFSSAGPIARDVRDAATLLAVLAGPDPRDPLSTRTRPPDYLAQLDEPIDDLRLTWLTRSGLVDATKPILDSCRSTIDAIGQPVQQSHGSLDAGRWRAAFYDMMMADRYATGGARFYENQTNRALLTDYARTHFQRAAEVTGAQYSHALHERAYAIRTLEDLMANADVLLTPTVGMIAPELAADNSPIPDDARLPYVAYTFIVNYTGFTAATVPCGFVDGLPVGLQAIGRPGGEADVLRVCRAIERTQPTTPLIR